MQNINRLFPRQVVPEISIDLVNGEKWQLSKQKNKNFTLIVIYRGLHCPICSKYLADLQRRVDKFSELGVGVIAVSSDVKSRADQAKQDWQLDSLALGYGLELQTAKELGLFISSGRGKTSIGIEEPALFVEPGLFVIRPDRTLYFSSIQTMPFARPNFAEVASSLEFVINNDYPARGEVIEL